MFIKAQETPNPNSLKFLIGVELNVKEPVSFSIGDSSVNSSIARSVLSIDGVNSLMIATDYITVTKYEDYSWDVIKILILSTLTECLSSGTKVFDDSEVGSKENKEVFKEDKELSKEEKEIVSQVKKLLDEKIRPAVATDGGDVLYKRYKDGVVFLEMRGACVGCPSATMTLKYGIRNLLQHYIPEILDVEEEG